MSRKTWTSMVAAGLLAAFSSSVIAEDFTITSNLVTFGDPNANQFMFDFPTPEASMSRIKAITVHWEVDLPSGATFPDPQPAGDLILNGDLSFGLENAGVGFLLTVPKAGGTAMIDVTKTPITDAAGAVLLSDLTDDAGNIVTAGFTGGGDFASFFQATGANGEPSVIRARMSLLYEGQRGAGGGGGGDPPVPEPASLLVWGGLGAAYFVRRRMTANKA